MLDAAKTIAIEKVAEHLGVSSWTIRTWIRAGMLSSHKVGRRVLLVEDEVRDLLTRTYRPAARPVVPNGRVSAPPRPRRPKRAKARRP